MIGTRAAERHPLATSVARAMILSSANTAPLIADEHGIAQSFIFRALA